MSSRTQLQARRRRAGQRGAEQFAGAKEMAKALGVSRNTIWIRARSGELPVLWVNGKYVIRRRTLERLVAAQRAASPPDRASAPASHQPSTLGATSR